MANHTCYVVRGAVNAGVVDQALKAINEELYNGYPADEAARALRESHWFPWARSKPGIEKLRWNLPGELNLGEFGEYQIVLKLPHNGPVRLNPHVDQPPPGRRLRRIVGLALTPVGIVSGGVVAWPVPGDADEVKLIELNPGDALVMGPEIPHCSCPNLTGAVRYMVYMRWLATGSPS